MSPLAKLYNRPHSTHYFAKIRMGFGQAADVQNTFFVSDVSLKVSWSKEEAVSAFY